MKTNSADDIDSLIERWEDARDEGRDIPVEELCRERPDLLTELRRQIDALRAFESFQERDTKPSGEPTPAPMPREVNGYEVLELLGRGGMGVVYKARQPGLGRIVALKMILAAEHAGAEIRARFRREAEAAARLHHPGIVQIYEVGSGPNGDYIAMEYVEGGSLADELDGSPWKAPEAAALVAHLAEAIDHAHRAEIVHRDLKPANILRNAERGIRNAELETRNKTTLAEGNSSPGAARFAFAQAKITDFGIAKRLDEEQAATASGQILGTPSYMAPEQAAGHSRLVGPATDVYALGAILYELLAGRPPFRAASAIDTIRQVIDDEPVSLVRLNSKAPRDLETITQKCLHKEPARRYASAADLAADLKRFLAGEPIHARPVGTIERSIKWAKRRPTAAALIGVCVLALTGLITGSAIYNARLKTALDDKNQALEREKAQKEKVERELDRSNRLFSESDQLARWMLNDHLLRLASLRGEASVRAQLVERLVSHLETLKADVVENSHLSADVNAIELAIAFERLGDAQGSPNSSNLGDTVNALANYEKSLDLRGQLLNKNPNDLKVLLGFARCLRRKGDVYAVQEKIPEARGAYDKALSRLLELIKMQPDDKIYRAEELAIRLAIADLAALKQGKEAADLYQDLLESSRDAFGEKPTDVSQISFRAVIHSRIGNLLENDRKFEAALKHYTEVDRLIGGLVDQLPDHATLQTQLSTALISLGDLLSYQKMNEQALEKYRRAAVIRRTHARADMNNTGAGHALSVALERLASLHLQMNNPNAALAPLNEALELRHWINRTKPDDIVFARSLWILEGQFGENHLALNETADAERHLLEMNKLAGKLAQKTKNPTDMQGVAESIFHLGRVSYQKSTKVESLYDAVTWTERAGAQAREAVMILDFMSKFVELNGKQKRLRDAMARFAGLMDDVAGKLKASGVTIIPAK